MASKCFLLALEGLLRAALYLVKQERCDPPVPDDDVIRVTARASRFYVNDTKPPPGDEMTNTVDLTIPALSFNAVLPGIVFMKGAAEVHPKASRVRVTSSDDSVVAASYGDATADGQAVTFVPNSGAAEDATCTITISADETGTADDLICNMKIGPFSITSTSVDVSRFRINDVDPNVPADPPADPPVDPPAEPTP